ncbi:outer membrane beta-barrel protein [Beggiatoa alba]|nr:outer membrane beta-barrel protein [Beggiatoa alba]
MKLLQSTFLIALSLSMSATSFAADNWYGGIAFGTADIDSGVTNLSGTTLDEDDGSTSVIVGYSYSPSFSLEGHIANLGTFSATAASAGDTFDYKGSTYVASSAGDTATGETSSLGVSAVYRFLDDAFVSPFVKVGLHYWSLDISGIEGLTEDDGVGLLAGVGIDMNFNGGLILRADFSHYQTDESVAIIGLSALWQF